MLFRTYFDLIFINEVKDIPKPTMVINKDTYVPSIGASLAIHNTIADKIANKINLPFEVIFHLSTSDLAIAKLKMARLIARIKPYTTARITAKDVKKPVNSSNIASIGTNTNVKIPIPALTKGLFIRA